MNRERCIRVFGFLAAFIVLLVSLRPGNAAELDAPRRIGVLLVAWSVDSKETQAFRQGLREAGYVEGRDVLIEWRLANGDYERVPELAADLVKSRVDVIVSDSTIGTRALKRATPLFPS